MRSVLGVAPPPEELQQLAQKLLSQGYFPLRVEPDSKAPRSLGWQTRVPTPESLQREFARPSNLGLRMGDPQKDGTCLLTIDIDLENIELIRCVERAIGAPVPVKQGRKGFSYIVRVLEGAKTHKIQWVDRETRKKVAAIDILCRGAQTIIPPSIHPETKLPYRWVAGPRIEDVGYQEIPVFTSVLLDEIQGFAKNPEDPVFAPNDMEWKGEGGGGNTHDTCVAAVASMVARKWTDEDIHERIMRAKREACEAAGMPFDWPRARKTIQEWIDSARSKAFDVKTSARNQLSHGLLADQFLRDLQPQIRYDWKRQSMAMFVGKIAGFTNRTPPFDTTSRAS